MLLSQHERIFSVLYGKITLTLMFYNHVFSIILSMEETCLA